MHYPQHLLKLIQVLKRLPGVGHKTAERFAFYLLDCSEGDLHEMAQILALVKDKITCCDQCGCFIGDRGCGFCTDARRNPALLCVIASPKEAFAIEETRTFQGLYHVIGGLLSPLDRKGPEHLSLDRLKRRIAAHGVEEVVIALDSTLEGDATSLYLKQELAKLPVRISRLAFGLPMGSTLDYVDGSTLARAFAGRTLC